MKKIRRLGTLMVSILVMMTLGACNKNKDELVLVTTESTTMTEATTEASTEELITEVATEEAQGAENSISFEDMYDCNKGDTLLAGGESYGVNTIYYSGEEESYSEYEFLGFDNTGMYAQVYENSDGRVEVLDVANSYWYVFEENQLSVLIYPEPLVAAAIIDSNHNSMIFGLSGREDGTEVVENVYRREGKLIVETVYNDASGENYMLEYTLNDDWIVEEFYCYDSSKRKMSYSLVTAGDTYEIPDLITEAQAMVDGYRTITFTYVNEDQIDMTYYTPLNVPIELSLMEYVAYSDQECTVEWALDEPGEDGVYKDVTIYLKKNVD